MRQAESRTPVRVVQVDAEVLSLKRVGPYHHLTLVAPGVAELFRSGNFLTLAVGGAHSSMLLRRSFPIYRVRETGAYGGTVEVVFEVDGTGTKAMSSMRPGDPVNVVGPLGRPFGLPKEPVACTLVGEGPSAAALFSLAERLRERGCSVHMLLGAPTESRLFGALEAKRAAQSVVVATEDGSVGIRGPVTQVLPELLSRTRTDVVYGSGPLPLLRAVAEAAEYHGAWSQTVVGTSMPCGIGVCMACVLPVAGEDGVTRFVRACVEGPVFRGDRVDWRAVRMVPEGVRGGTR